MLRRKPTAITLTAEDISSYEDRQAREITLLQEQALRDANLKADMEAEQQLGGMKVTPQRTQNRDPKEEVKAEKGKKTRDERLGIAGRS
jgi:Anaphase-promoting complex APC subunit CDC26